MRHFGAVCGPGASHIATMSAIGRELQARGCRFTLFQFSDAVKPTETGTSSGRSGSAAQSAFLQYMVKRAQWICGNAPALLTAAKLDCLLVDAIDPATAAVGEMLQIPYVTINSALPLNAEPLAPPDFLPWRFHDTWWARLRNTLAYKVRDFIISPLNRTLNGYRRQWSLRPYRTPNDSFSTLAQITQLVREFDLPRTRLPGWFHYVGPYRREQEDVQDSFRYDRLDGRTLLYASLGTRQSIGTPLWKEISESCLGLDVQLVIALGGHGLSQQIGALPGDPIIVDYAPQISLLSCAALAITHGGLNSAMEALAAGVPMIVLPMSGDQFGVAARVMYAGVGKTMPGSQCTSSSLRQLIKTLLADTGYYRRTQELKLAISQTTGVRRAADIIEEAAATRRPVLAQ